MLTASLPVRIYYEDTDAGGVVYYANYLKFFERGRTESLREINVNQSELLQSNIAFVVKKVEMDCVKSARFDDLITIKTRVKSHRKASMIFEQEIVHSNGDLLCKSTTLIACVNLEKMKPTAIPVNIIKEITCAR